MERVLHVDILSILFGLGTWLCVNGLWVELPLLVQKLPEGWNLPSYLSITGQIANVGPLLYTILNSFFPKVITEKRSIYFVMIIGLISTILLSFFWDETTFIFGTERSTALIVLVFFLSAVDCSSRVMYLPFMAQFQEMYLTPYFIGEGLSGFVPSIIALGQGVGGNPECRNNTNGTGLESYTPDPRFSTSVFFYFLFAFTLISAVAFYLLNLDKVVQRARIPNDNNRSISPSVRSKSSSSRNGSMYGDNSVFELPRANLNRSSSSNPEEGSTNNPAENNNREVSRLNRSGSTSTEVSMLLGGISRSSFISLLTLLAFTCFLANGTFPSIQSYSCLPYGNVVYHLAVTLSTMANPAVCFLAFFIPPPNKKSIFSMAILSFGVAGYVLATAVMSPEPPLVGETSGEVLLVLSWIVMVGLFTYVKVGIATILRTMGKSGLFWCGAITQVGSTFGAIVTFCIVNYTNTFKDYSACGESW